MRWLYLALALVSSLALGIMVVAKAGRGTPWGADWTARIVVGVVTVVFWLAMAVKTRRTLR